MGKINNKSGVEIIPLKDINKKINRSINRVDHNRSVKMNRLPYIADPTLVPRVQKYLESNVDKTYVDINVMADDLQRSYREYARLKRNAFRNSVKKAYSVVLQSYGLEDPDNTSSEDDVSDESTPEEGSSFHNSTMNDQLLDLYSRPVAPKQIDENELIDISSDNSDGAIQPLNNDKSSNGASTSQSKMPPTSGNFQNNIPAKKAIDRKNDRYPPINSDRGKKRKLDVATITPFASASKRKKSLATLQEPSVTFKDVGGLDKVLTNVARLLSHVHQPEVYRRFGVSPPKGILLHGPPGCGKTLLAHAIAGEIGVPLLQVTAPLLVAGVSGQSEERIRELFERAICSIPCVLFIDEIDTITQNRQNAQKDMERRIVAQLLSCLDDLRQNENGDRVLVIGATSHPGAIDPALRRAGRFDREICLGMPNLQSRVQILKVLTSKLPKTEELDYESIAKLTPGFVGADLMHLTAEAITTAVDRILEAHKEQRQLEEAIRAQKAAEEEKKKKDSVKEAASDQNKSDQEIIVDDEVVNPIAVSSETSGDAIVVIDDDTKQVNENPVESVVNGDALPAEDSKVLVDPEPMPVDLVKPRTELEDSIWWLHNSSRLTPAQLNSLCVTVDDFVKALKLVQPAATREGFAMVPDVTWADVGSLSEIRDKLKVTILAPVRHPEVAKRFGITTPAGVLLCGPPGCGKTLLAKAIANEAGINFISVKGPELLNMYLGESERAIRVCFERARNSAPCVIFFDELDAICPKRSDAKEEGTTKRVVNQMLTEMDGIGGRKDVYVLAASNRPDIIDPAILRPGRLDKILFIGLPTASDRVDILRAITKNGTNPVLAPDVDLEVIGKSENCRGYTGADLASLVREAANSAFEEYMLHGDMQQPAAIRTEHFKMAVANIRPSVPEKDLKHYEKLRKMYAAVPEQDVEEMEYS